MLRKSAQTATTPDPSEMSETLEAAQISTTAKGNQLEEAFVKWMEDNGYHSVEHGRLREFSCIGGIYKPDIFASRSNYFWIFLSVISIIYTLVCLLMFWIKFGYMFDHCYIFVPTGMLAVILYAVIKDRRLRTVHYWVECKNTKNPVDRPVVHKLYVSTTVAKEKNLGRWRGILVSRADFRPEILELASYLKIQCYLWTQKEFQEFQEVRYGGPAPDPLEPYCSPPYCSPPKP